MFLMLFTNLMAVATFVCVGINEPTPKPTTVLSATLTALNPPCWLNWAVTDALLSDPGYTPEIWRLSSKNVIWFKRKAALYPNKLWLFWNEPEHTDQANTPPGIAASLTISYAQALDGNGSWACCGNMIDSNGLAWLDSYVAQGGPMPDVWHVHIYSAADIAEWNIHLNDWWQWWDQHGAGKPVIISETSLMWQPAAKQTELLRYLLSYDDPRIKQIYWFSALLEPTVPSWGDSRLLNSDFTKTDLGKVYAPDLGDPALTPMATATPTPTLTMTPTPTYVPTAPPTPFLTITPTPTEPAQEPVEGVSLPYQIYLPYWSRDH